MSRPRSLVLLLTILALIYMAANQPKKVEVIEVRYCPVVEWTWRDGKKLWCETFGPCERMDRFENT